VQFARVYDDADRVPVDGYGASKDSGRTRANRDSGTIAGDNAVSIRRDGRSVHTHTHDAGSVGDIDAVAAIGVGVARVK
jgi:hypothetical protein